MSKTQAEIMQEARSAKGKAPNLPRGLTPYQERQRLAKAAQALNPDSDEDGWVRARLRKGINSPFQMFTAKQWNQMEPADHMKFWVIRSDEPGNLFQLADYARRGTDRKRKVFSTLGQRPY